MNNNNKILPIIQGELKYRRIFLWFTYNLKTEMHDIVGWMTLKSERPLQLPVSENFFRILKPEDSL